MVDAPLNRACGAGVLVDLLHGMEIDRVCASKGAQADLVLAALVSGLDQSGVYRGVVVPGAAIIAPLPVNLVLGIEGRPVQ